MRSFEMPRFYFHLEDGERIYGRERLFFNDVEEARAAALDAAREILAGDAGKAGDRIVIADENDNAIMAVPFAAVRPSDG
ncbi:hypothetical protein E2493_09345 [Sphingomonas parva]|uniref:DUF6894 domain-containing protein n=1 Tax=Sphingomonas parva TaxID=2555898 RepID=A0A4Y8ZRR4_9SPHN|nr:hypothetical protein [Sphingomonas parva]TFI58614.1 hypothetical protein E2493_09345 [Sphingomonas parva]